MKRVPLVFGGADYWDRTLALIDGVVEPEGIDLHWVMKYPGEFFGQMIRGEFEAGEMSAGFLVMLKDQDNPMLVGLPLFTSRAFRHGNIMIHADAGIEKPQDLKGKRVGVPDYPMTSAIWVRGFLKADFGVAAEDMEWFQGGLESPGFVERVPTSVRSGIKLTTVHDRALLDMFMNRELDAITGPALPPSLAGNPKVKLLFPNHKDVEKEYYARTGLFPITHMVVMRRDVYERHRWMARSLCDAFERSKQIGWQEYGRHQAGNAPWLSFYLRELNQVFGGNPYKDGFHENLPVLEALTQYCFEQGMTKRKIDPTELFAPETLIPKGH